MEITNMSMAAIWVREDEKTSITLPASAILRTKAKKVTIRVSRLPCTVEVKDRKYKETMTKFSL